MYKAICIRHDRSVEPQVFVLEREERGVRSPQWVEVELPGDVNEREAVAFAQRCVAQGEEPVDVLNEISLGRVP